MQEKSGSWKVNHLVVDSVALIKNHPIFDIGANIYTVSQVVSEIRDRATRERLQILPREITIMEPTPESMKTVTEFSKKTGDYPVLSAVDMRLLALTYELHKTHVGLSDVRTVPLPQVSESGPLENVTNIPGFFYPSRTTKEAANTITSNTREGENGINDYNYVEDDEKQGGEGEEEKVEEEVDEQDQFSDDDVGWVTPENIQDAIKSMKSMNLKESQMEVACITADFAMQNTLIQMGLKVVSVDGLEIKEAKTYILRCFGCMKTTSKMTLVFCPHCGNKTLRRVPVTVKDDGTKIVHLCFRRPINLRRSNYSLPKPKGGKHSNNPILCADQPVPQNRASKLGRKKTDALNEDYIAETSPFALIDIYTRAGNLGIRGNRNNQNFQHKPRPQKYKK